MDSKKQAIALSRALFELRSGRAIGLGALYFQPVESENLPVGAMLVAPASLDRKFLPAEARPAENENEECAIMLLKQAGLLPAFAVVDNAEMTFSAEELRHALASESTSLQRIAEASLPLRHSEDVRIISYRHAASAADHLAVVVGQPEAQPAPLVRVHSSCVTGDLLGSLRCDCGDQLHLALEMIAKAGHGVLCYLHQEGRGIGISNKIRAYALQEEGQDTLDANLSLGFEADERNFGLAAAMLSDLAITNITLLTNNPDKVGQLSDDGIQISAQQPLHATPSDHNAKYLATKVTRFGHKIAD